MEVRKHWPIQGEFRAEAPQRPKVAACVSPPPHMVDGCDFFYKSNNGQQRLAYAKECQGGVKQQQTLCLR